MKFIIRYTGSALESKIIYDVKDCSFDTIPALEESYYNLALNEISLTVSGDNRIAQVWGFSGYRQWIKFIGIVPSHSRGTIEVIDNLDYGFSHKIADSRFPVYVNWYSGWVCIGDPLRSDSAVEFIINCIAVLDHKMEFVALWIKLDDMPPLT